MSSVFYLDDGLVVLEAVAVLHPHHLQVLPPPSTSRPIMCQMCQDNSKMSFPLISNKHQREQINFNLIVLSYSVCREQVRKYRRDFILICHIIGRGWYGRVWLSHIYGELADCPYFGRSGKE